MQDTLGYVRIAAATPAVRVADPAGNVRAMEKMITEAAARGAAVIVFPELAVTGYTCGDLFKDRALMAAAEEALFSLIQRTADLPILCAVGMPVPSGGALYNCAAVFAQGRLLGLPAKQNIPVYSEFYEARHFSPAPQSGVLRFHGETYPAKDVIFELTEDVRVGVEICEDVWVADPPSVKLAKGGATVLLNLSCSDEIIGKAGYRRDMLKIHSGRLLAAYAYADSGFGESTTDMVFAGHDLICENGSLLKESELFSSGIIYGDVDAERLVQERRRMNTWKDEPCCTVVPAGIAAPAFETDRVMAPYPFVPSDDADLSDRCGTILRMQATGLATRLRHIGARTVALALSGGLDSTLALLVAVRAFDFLGLDRKGIHTVSMPCFGTTSRTKSNAQSLAEELGVSFAEIPIAASVTQHLSDIGHDLETLDVTFENAQARERTQVVMDLANQIGGIVLGTGDLSELALGWATYNGDHMSMYAVNCSVPKTLVRYLVRHVARESGEALERVLLDILATPVSPELLPPKDGEISQRTEDLVGPYALHDYFLYYMLRFGFTPKKIYAMALRSFAGEFDAETIRKWLRVFYRRFFQQQFKRSCLPDGPKVGSVTLSPRGDFRMPSDAVSALWLEEIDRLGEEEA